MTYNYHKQQGNSSVVITLHGTGGDMHDLDAVAQYIAPEATIIGLEGDVNEHGMLRWFKRSSPGVFDEEDLRKRADNLASWLVELAKKESFDLSKAVFIGFSNGANMLAALLHLHPGLIRNAALLHGQIPLSNSSFPPQQAKVFVGTGHADNIISYEQSKKLADSLQQSGVETTFFAHEYGHTLTEDELIAVNKFFY